MELAKKLVPYLPYGLQVQTSARKATKSGEKLGYKMGTLHGIYFNYGNPVSVIFREDGDIMDLNLNEFKPILHPLSDLTKPCLSGGLTPIFELCDLQNQKIYWTETGGKTLIVNESFKNQKAVLFDSYEDFGTFGYCIKSSTFYGTCNNGDVQINIVNQLQLFEKLFEWHYDVYDLIKQKKAININKIKQ